MTHPLRSTGITPLHRYYRTVRPSPAHRYFQPRGCSRLRFSLGIAGQVLTFRTRARLSFAPPTCRMPLGQSQCIPQAYPGRWVSPRFWHRLIAFRHFNSGSLALASLNHACQNLVPAFPQRSPPWLLTTAACGGLRSTPDCRSRRALLHLSYSCIPPCGPAILVTQDPTRTCNKLHVCSRPCRSRVQLRIIRSAPRPPLGLPKVMVCRLAPADFAMRDITRSSRIDIVRLRKLSPRF